VAVAGGPSATEQEAALADVGRRWRAPRTAPAIEVLEDRVERAALPVSEGARVALGLDTGSRPVWCGLDRVPSFLVLGLDGTGRSTALGTVAESLTAGDPSLEAYLLAPRRSGLPGRSLWTDVAEGHQACQDLATRLAVLVQDRARDGGPPLLVVIDDGDELLDGVVSTHLETVVKRGRDVPAYVVAAAQTPAARRAFSGWMSELRLLLVPDVMTDGDLLGVQLPRKQFRSWPPGRGYLVCRGTSQLVQVAT